MERREEKRRWIHRSVDPLLDRNSGFLGFWPGVVGALLLGGRMDGWFAVIIWMRYGSPPEVNLFIELII